MRAPLQIHMTRARTRAHAHKPIALAGSGCTPCIGYSKPGERAIAWGRWHRSQRKSARAQTSRCPCGEQKIAPGLGRKWYENVDSKLDNNKSKEWRGKLGRKHH